MQNNTSQVHTFYSNTASYIEANSNYKAIRENARKVSKLLNVPIVEVK